MDIYHIWCDLRPGVGDMAFSEAVTRYLDHLREGGHIAAWRCTRAKLGFSARGLGEWHVMIETRDLGQLEMAFQHVASRSSPVEDFHFHVNSLTVNASFALYRDFPDPTRHRGEERF